MLLYERRLRIPKSTSESSILFINQTSLKFQILVEIKFIQMSLQKTNSLIKQMTSGGAVFTGLSISSLSLDLNKDCHTSL